MGARLFAGHAADKGKRGQAFAIYKAATAQRARRRPRSAVCHDEDGGGLSFRRRYRVRSTPTALRHRLHQEEVIFKLVLASGTGLRVVYIFLQSCAHFDSRRGVPVSLIGTGPPFALMGYHQHAHPIGLVLAVGLV